MKSSKKQKTKVQDWLHRIAKKLNENQYIILAGLLLTIVPGAIAVYEFCRAWYIEEYLPCEADFIRDDSGEPRDLKGIPLDTYAGDERVAEWRVNVLSPEMENITGLETWKNYNDNKCWFDPSYTREVVLKNNLDRELFVKKLRVELSDVKIDSKPYIYIVLHTTTNKVSSVNDYEDKEQGVDEEYLCYDTHMLEITNIGASDVEGLVVELSGNLARILKREYDGNAIRETHSCYRRATLYKEIGNIHESVRIPFEWRVTEDDPLSDNYILQVTDIIARDKDGNEICIIGNNLPYEMRSSNPYIHYPSSNTYIGHTLADTGSPMPIVGLSISTEGNASHEQYDVSDRQIDTKSPTLFSKSSYVYEMPVSLTLDPDGELMQPILFFPDIVCSGKIRVEFDVVAKNGNTFTASTETEAFQFSYGEESYKLMITDVESKSFLELMNGGRKDAL